MHWLVISFLITWTSNPLFFNDLSVNTFQENEYLENYNTVSFFESKLADQTIDLENIDEDLINATLYFYINKKRTERRRKAFHRNESLFQTCQNFTEKYSGNSLKRFRKKKTRFEKLLKKSLKQTEFNGTYFNGLVDYIPLLKFNKKKKYVYDEEFNDGENLFFYKKKKRKQPLISIEVHTYLSLAERIFKRSNFQERSRSISGKESLYFGKAVFRVGLFYFCRSKT